MVVHDICFDPKRRHEAVLFFDITNGNPNGDPDASNSPRVDIETMLGYVTDVALKRKVRDYVATVLERPIFMQSKVALNTLIHQSFKDVGVEPLETTLTEQELEDEELLGWIHEKEEESFTIEGDRLLYAGEIVKEKELAKVLLSGLEDQKDLAKQLRDLAKRLIRSTEPAKRITKEKREEAKDKLCQKYFDIRMFGAVLSTGLNAGQVRGPVQFSFARSVNRVNPIGLTITRQARTTGIRMQSGPTEMGRKSIIPYGLYRAHIFYNPFLAEKTGVTEQDLKDFWEAVSKLFEFDHSAARSEMFMRKVWIFSHETAKGNAPAHKLFEMINQKKKDKVEIPESFGDYQFAIDEDHLPPGVYLTTLLE